MKSRPILRTWYVLVHYYIFSDVTVQGMRKVPCLYIFFSYFYFYCVIQFFSFSVLKRNNRNNRLLFIVQAKIRRDVCFQYQGGPWLAFWFTLSRTQLRSHLKISTHRGSLFGCYQYSIALPGVVASDSHWFWYRLDPDLDSEEKNWPTKIKTKVSWFEVLYMLLWVLKASPIALDIFG